MHADPGCKQGERAIDVGTARTVTLVLGLVLLLAAVAARLLRQGSLHPAYRAPERVLLVLYLVGLGALALFIPGGAHWSSSAPAAGANPMVATRNAISATTTALIVRAPVIVKT